MSRGAILLTVAVIVITVMGGILRASALPLACLSFNELDEQAFVAEKTTWALMKKTPALWCPLYFLPAHLVNVMLDKPSPAALRTPAAVFGTLSIPAIFLLARMLFGARIALMSAVLLAVNPYHVRWSTTARGYSLLMLISILLTIALVSACRHNSWRRWLLYVVVGGLACYTHRFAPFVIASHSAALLVMWAFQKITRKSTSDGPLPARGQVLLKLLISAAVIACLTVPLALRQAPKIAAYTRFVGAAEHAPPKLGTGLLVQLSNTFFVCSDTAGPLTWRAAVLALLFVAGVVAGSIRKEYRGSVFLLLVSVALPLSATLYVIGASGYFFNARHVVYVLPFVVLVCAVGIEGCVRGANALCRRFGYGSDSLRAFSAVTAFAILLVFSLPLHEFVRSRANLERKHGSYRHLSELLRLNMKDDDGLLFTNPGLRFVLDYYGSVEPVSAAQKLSVEDLESLLAQHNRLWVVNVGSAREPFREWLGSVRSVRLRFQEYAWLEIVPSDGDTLSLLNELCRSDHPTSFPLCTSLGNALVKHDDHARAARYFFRAAVLDPSSVDTPFRLAECLTIAGEFAAAERVYRALIDSSESSRKRAYIRLAQLLGVQGKTADAETVLLTAYKTLDDPRFAVLLCRLYRRNSELEKGFELVVDASSSFPTHGDVWFEFGECLLAKREPKRAVDAYQRAVSLNPDNPYFYHGLARAYEACGDTPKAFEARQQLMNLDAPASLLRSLDKALGLPTISTPPADDGRSG